MLGDFVYSEEEAEVEGRKPEAAYGHDAPRKVEKTLRRFLALAALVVCGGLVWWFFVSPAMVPATVNVFGFPGLDDAAALRYARIGDSATFVSVNAAEAQRLLSRHPLVESARVVRGFPDRISIYLEPRQAVAVGLARVNGRILPVYFDRHGVAFSIGDAPPIGAPSWLPVVSGLSSGDLALYLGARLPEPILPLFSRIGAILDEEPGIWQAISEIGVEWNDNGTYDLVLFPANNFIRIRMGSDISANGIFYALLMLDVVRGFGGDAPDEIDVRSGIGVLSSEGGGRRGG